LFNAKQGKNNKLFLAIVLVFLVIAALFVYLILYTPVGKSGLPAGASSLGGCALFQNKYTSEFKCLSCVVEANNPNAGCIYASRDWNAVASGAASGYSCEYDAALELKCRTLKVDANS
jgi:hypothetical protein